MCVCAWAKCLMVDSILLTSMSSSHPACPLANECDFDLSLMSVDAVVFEGCVCVLSDALRSGACGRNLAHAEERAPRGQC